jgi:hypothetical protein
MSPSRLSSRRLLLALLVGAAGAVGIGASPAAATVTIGQTFMPTDDFGGSGVFIQSTSPNNSYVVPGDGVITSWSFEAGAGVTPPMKLKIVRPAGGNDFTTVGDSQLVTPTPETLNTWPTRIAVKAGDLPAHFYTDTTFGFRDDTLGYDSHFIAGSTGDPNLDPPPGATTTYEFDEADQIDLSAALEPDADRDAYGDETQDKCLGTPGAFNGCPSTFKLNKVKQKRGATKISVNLTVPGAGTVAVGSPGDPALASTSKKSVKAKTTTETTTGKHGVFLKLKLTKGAAGKLARSGAIKVKVQAVYTPPGGPPASLTAKTKLKS